MDRLVFARATAPAYVVATLGVALLGCSSSSEGAAPVADAGAPTLPPLESKPPASIDASARLDAASSPLAFDAKRGGVWTANGDVGTVSYVDPAVPRVVREIVVGKDVRSVALSPDFAWVAAVDREGAGVALIRAEDGVVARIVPLGTHPRAAVWDAENPRYLYVAVEDPGVVAVVDRTLGAVATSLDVGRLPSGLAVSRQRRELYVTHRIDPQVTIVDLEKASVAAQVAIAEQPANDDPTLPQGKPFAFEGMAWAADGNVAWLPHELLAPTHPFQFRQTLFPTVSVVDLAARAEVVTDPNDPIGAIAGRKNLFDAIDVLDATGSPSVLSQPCAAVFHPAGLAAYALACASEDLLVFDTTTGIASDLVRNLPGDHPVGLALDDRGARLFVLSDQSHTMLIMDTAGGSPVGRVTQVGSPLHLVARDPVDPELRAGLELFYGANSSKNALATTANNWMACGGCHLDGFVGTNEVFFDLLKPVDPTKDAQIGHVGLYDSFATAPTPHASSFKPHDILVALLDQGGLDQDRTGAHPTGLVDPDSPPAPAVQMATELARVIERDLPVGPSWLLDRSKGPNPQYDGAWCGSCHAAEYQAWSKSVHAKATVDPMMQYCAHVETQLRGPAVARLCAGCHDPVGARIGDATLTSQRGVSCLGCHDVTRTIRAGGNADLEATTNDWTADHAARAKASLDTLRDPRFCGGCHQQFVPGTGLLPAFATLREWQGSPYASQATPTRCVDCHMPQTGSGADHRAVGGNLYAGHLVGDDGLVADETAKIQEFVDLTATRQGSAVTVDVYNRGSGHAFPTGVSDLREAWVEVRALDGSGRALARIGGPGPDGTLPDGAARFGTDLASADGTLLLRHELSVTTRLPFDRRVLPHEHVQVSVSLPASMPSGTASLEAVLVYRNVRTSYFRLATGDAGALPPETDLATAKVGP